MKTQLVVTSAVAAAATDLFLRLAPRTLVLAGGDTPRPVYACLAATPYPWEQVRVFFGDERCVGPEHPASNYRMAHETLLAHVPAQAFRMPGETCDAEAYEQVLRAQFSRPAPEFDLVFLGLGEDGHTASLFPGDPALEEKERWVATVHRPDQDRLTLTPPAFSGAKTVIFLVTGASKRSALARYLAGDPEIAATRITAASITVIVDPAASP